MSVSVLVVSLFLDCTNLPLKDEVQVPPSVTERQSLLFSVKISSRFGLAGGTLFFFFLPVLVPSVGIPVYNAIFN
jgi:hypothetical protein